MGQAVEHTVGLELAALIKKRQDGVTRHLSAGVPTVCIGAWTAARLSLEDTGYVAVEWH